MDGNDRMLILSKALAQDRIGDDQLSGLAERACELDVDAGRVLMRSGQMCTEWFVVVTGRVEVCSSGGRRHVAVGGEVIACELSPSSDMVARWTIEATALEPCVLLAIAVSGTVEPS